MADHWVVNLAALKVGRMVVLSDGWLAVLMDVLLVVLLVVLMADKKDD